MARARKKATRKRRVLDLATPRAEKRGRRSRPEAIFWSVSAPRKRNPEDHDFAIMVADDESGWHYWVMEQRSGSQVATSTKAYSTELGALQAGQRAGRRHKAAQEARNAPKEAKAKKGRRRLPSALSRI